MTTIILTIIGILLAALAAWLMVLGLQGVDNAQAQIDNIVEMDNESSTTLQSYARQLEGEKPAVEGSGMPVPGSDVLPKSDAVQPASE